MLRTGKQVWEATAKRRAIDLRREELDFHMQRYTVLITQASLLTGFAFESIVHLEPCAKRRLRQRRHHSQVSLLIS